MYACNHIYNTYIISNIYTIAYVSTVCINRISYIHSMEHYSAAKIMHIFKNLMLSERSQNKKLHIL